MRIISLGSGSQGNSYIVESGNTAVMIDCGFNCKQLCIKAEAADFDLSRLSGILLTHEHTDHVAALKVFRKKFNLAIYSNSMTAEKTAARLGMDIDDFFCFENYQSFEIGELSIVPFSTPHDAVDSVGYFINSPDGAYFHGTDFGTPLESIGRFFEAADFATLESNHDLSLLWQSDRSIDLKRRIAGESTGHLSNEQAALLVKKFASNKLKRLALAHLSEDCNSPHLAERSMREALAHLGREDVSLCILDRFSPVRIV